MRELKLWALEGPGVEEKGEGEAAGAFCTSITSMALETEGESEE
jgi:hypothetical protein